MHPWTVDDRPGRRWEGKLPPPPVVRQHGPDSCALDVVDRNPDGMELDAIGQVMGMSGERVRQLQESGEAKLRASKTPTEGDDVRPLVLEVESCDDCPCSSDGVCEHPLELARATPTRGVPSWCPMRARGPVVMMARLAEVPESPPIAAMPAVIRRRRVAE